MKYIRESPLPRAHIISLTTYIHHFEIYVIPKLDMLKIFQQFKKELGIDSPSNEFRHSQKPWLVLGASKRCFNKIQLLHWR